MDTTMTLAGYVGHALELKHTRTGVSTVSFRVGSTPRIRTENGWEDGTTTWVSVVCYRALADHAVRSLNKGDPVIVHGRVRTQSWADPEGVIHERMVIEAGSVGHDLNRGVSAFARAYLRPTDTQEIQTPEEAEATTAQLEETGAGAAAEDLELVEELMALAA
jgi:single-strand DNA-binding protein